ncbi:hypothetical protein AAVH_16453 [Aphelenchoides avenae]|nr:hypothetical protein AAVH_16453 [Aphelenchus avenae]
MKLFKTSEPAVKKLAEHKPVDLSPEEEDEDDDEPTGPEDDDVVIEEDLNPESSVVAATFHPSSAPPTRLQLSVSTGLKSTQEIYGFELSEPHEADMLKYRRYVQLAEVPPNTEVMSASENEGTLESFCKLQPLFEFTPSFFTVDSSFHTDLRRVSDKSLEIFKEVANKAKFDPPTAAARAYREYAPSTKSTPTNSVSSGSRS